MWCPHCQADVVAEASPESRRARCITCGLDITPESDLGRSEPVPRDPRALLARWAEEDAQDPLGPLFQSVRSQIPTHLPGTSADAASDTVTLGNVGALDSTSIPHVVRLEIPLSGQESSPPRPIGAKTASVAVVDGTTSTVGESFVSPGGTEAGESRPPLRLQHVYRDFRQTQLREALDNFDENSSTDPHPRSEEVGNPWLPVIGQMFAYLGVLTLFIGSVLVLMGYFGGRPEWSPTGWIIATAGQMLLFLGVVTLISAGLEQFQESRRQSDAELSRRMRRLERLMLDSLSNVGDSGFSSGRLVDSTSAARGTPPYGESAISPDEKRRRRIAELTAELDRLRAA